MKPTDDPDLIAEVELETWERCAKAYVDGFGAVVSEAIMPLLDAASVGVEVHSSFRTLRGQVTLYMRLSQKPTST